VLKPLLPISLGEKKYLLFLSAHSLGNKDTRIPFQSNAVMHYNEFESMNSNEVQDTPQHSEPRRNGVLETLRFIVISLVIVFAIRNFIAQPFIVSGESMLPTFEDGEYLIVDEVSYRFEEPARGDVIILRYPLEPQKYFIKRIIGLPGETLQFQGTTIAVTKPGGGDPLILSEPYIKDAKNDFITVTLGGNEYYVLGDNRSASSDSRRWGALLRANIVGKPIVRLFPLSHIAWRPGAYSAGVTP
jgi:signal peptidase I